MALWRDSLMIQELGPSGEARKTKIHILTFRALDPDVASDVSPTQVTVDLKQDLGHRVDTTPKRVAHSILLSSTLSPSRLIFPHLSSIPPCRVVPSKEIKKSCSKPTSIQKKFSKGAIWPCPSGCVLRIFPSATREKPRESLGRSCGTEKF